MRCKAQVEGTLPLSNVLFLGGHQNMTKKLRQLYPNWTYVTDDQFNRRTNITQQTVFFWTGHSSHKMMRFVYSRLPACANVIYVTATNLERLTSEMQQGYKKILC